MALILFPPLIMHPPSVPEPRHADLLHFIAQKERKCLELRDQLAVHEKELAERE